jgi:toxin ParE1/3/4
MARIIRAPAAESDAVEIWSYIAEDNPDAADRLLDRIDRMFHAIAAQPQLGKRVEELAPNLRFVPIGNYLIFYRPAKDRVEIVRLLHGARDITAEFFRESSAGKTQP